ncbi:DUF2255 family protein [Homoserinibacter sp. GY 40078]|nr:DUF2255 family protein [Homoserinibacter sp. GY 40078]
MSGWDEAELASVDAGDEIEVSSVRPDGSLRPFVTIWGVAAGGHFYVRSAYGPRNGWYRRALARGNGRIRFAGGERDVTFAQIAPDAPEQAAIDAAYLKKYARYEKRILDTVIGPAMHAVTLRVEPRD